VYNNNMPAKKNTLKTIDDLTDKQKKFVEILVSQWGQISQVEAAIKAGYGSEEKKDATMVMASKLLNPNRNPHVARYLEMKLAEETAKYEKDKLRRYKIFDRLRDGAEQKGQYTGAINAEFRSGQLAGQFVDKKEISHTTLEGMSREKLEQRLKELENKAGGKSFILHLAPKQRELKLLVIREPSSIIPVSRLNINGSMVSIVKEILVLAGARCTEA
jgi:phage terminase small subunit